MKNRNEKLSIDHHLFVFFAYFNLSMIITGGCKYQGSHICPQLLFNAYNQIKYPRLNWRQNLARQWPTYMACSTHPTLTPLFSLSPSLHAVNQDAPESPTRDVEKGIRDNLQVEEVPQRSDFRKSAPFISNNFLATTSAIMIYLAWENWS
ncbi:uncharacterized protein LOC109710038 isoform X4 [Ananas comosus]|uniref:Uncharacterized protein LOC109710038 isoform X4 n=1 Tax=Ananas comosus TaxID=4615 RepID=A0A6P5EWT8_ANACO|nr:uncharacterized protein LOC109710038 isoform X4 [Ananas comosus]